MLVSRVPCFVALKMRRHSKFAINNEQALIVTIIFMSSFR